ncbi:MAG: DSD1 family PLP-dependent enzyme [Gammaproteobacteria bacterium]|jgi:3-hydroxy-D-aspartate aldolase
MQPRFWPTSLIGRSGSRYEIITPALILDLDAAERNFRLLRDTLRVRGLELRVNVKTHKCLALAKWQMTLGAIGVCCATLGEAAVMVEGGIGGVLIATPMTTPQKITEVMRLASKAQLLLAVDHPDNVAALSRAAAAAGVTLDVLIDVDPGSKRTGAATDDAVVALVEQVVGAVGLNYRGLQCYAGFIQHIENLASRREKNRQVTTRLQRLIERLRARGLAPTIISGGGTGTFDLDSADAVFTESQAGSFMFMDVQYEDVWTKDGLTPPFEPAMFVQTAIHSASHAGVVTTDAGSKRFATDGGRVVVQTPTPTPVEYKFHGDEHGKIFFADGKSHLSVGDRVECRLPHCDPTINLYDRIHCVRGDTLIDIWPIDARGI